jgi:hypothetical protein
MLGGAFRFRLILSPASSSYAIFIFYFLKKRKQSWAVWKRFFFCCSCANAKSKISQVGTFFFLFFWNHCLKFHMSIYVGTNFF